MTWEEAARKEILLRAIFEVDGADGTRYLEKVGEGEDTHVAIHMTESDRKLLETARKYDEDGVPFDAAAILKSREEI